MHTPMVIRQPEPSSGVTPFAILVMLAGIDRIFVRLGDIIIADPFLICVIDDGWKRRGCRSLQPVYAH